MSGLELLETLRRNGDAPTQRIAVSRTASFTSS
jgi:hypothetical protein